MSQNKNPNPFSLTQDQKRAYEALEVRLRDEFIVPLMDDIGTLVPRWAEMNVVERFNALSELNAPNIGKGECLPVVCPEYELAWFQAYSGDVVSCDFWAYGGRMGGILPLQFSEHSATQLSHGARFALMSSNFRGLPPAYRVAVIAEFVLENVVTGYSEAFAFALGSDKLKTYRVSIAPKVSITADMQTRRVEGWTIHVSDARPTNAQLLAAGRLIRAYDDAVQDPDFVVPFVRDLNELNEPDDHRKAKRSGDAELRNMVSFVDDLIASGTDPRRGGNSTWREVWRYLMRDRPDLAARYASSRSLMQSYSQYKKRHSSL